MSANEVNISSESETSSDENTMLAKRKRSVRNRDLYKNEQRNLS